MSFSARWAAACAVSLAGCNFVRDDINRTLGHSPEDRSRQTDIAASQVTTIGVNFLFTGFVRKQSWLGGEMGISAAAWAMKSAPNSGIRLICEP